MWNCKTLAVVFSFVITVQAWGACPGDTQAEMNECSMEDFNNTNAELNIVYRRLTKTPQLIAAERAWITYRDAECRSQSAVYEGGSMQPLVISLCLTELTRQRINILKSYEDE